MGRSLLMNDVRVFAIDGHAETDFEAIGLCANKLVEEGIVKDVFLSNCIEREKSYPTGLPCDPPVAMPHSAASGVISDGICVLRLDSPVKFHRMDDDQETVDVKMVFNLAVTDPQGHLKVLQSLMALFMDHDAMCDLYRSDIEEVPRVLMDYLANNQ
jgi:PTS system galactitol-specific IIA component